MDGIHFVYRDGAYSICDVCAWCGEPITNAAMAILRHDFATLGSEHKEEIAAIPLHKGDCDERWHQAHGKEGGFSDLGTALFDLLHNSFLTAPAGAMEEAKRLSEL